MGIIISLAILLKVLFSDDGDTSLHKIIDLLHGIMRYPVRFCMTLLYTGFLAGIAVFIDRKA